MLPQIGSIEELEIEEDVENIEAQMLNRDLEPASNIPEEITEEIKENMPSPLQQTLMIQKHNILAKNLEKLLFQEDFADIEIMAGDPPEKILAYIYIYIYIYIAIVKYWQQEAQYSRRCYTGHLQRAKSGKSKCLTSNQM